MKSVLAALAVWIIGSSSASATTLTFEDVPGSTSNWYGDIPTYQGFIFNYTLDWIDLVDSYWSYGAKSGEFAVLNNYGGTGVISAANGGHFSFDGLWAKAWGTQPESDGFSNLFGFLEGWSDGQRVWGIDTALNGSYQHFGPQAGLIDELHLGFGNHFLADDIQLTEHVSVGGEVAAVPLPSSLGLLLGGVGGIAFAARRCKRQAAVTA